MGARGVRGSSCAIMSIGLVEASDALSKAFEGDAGAIVESDSNLRLGDGVLGDRACDFAVLRAENQSVLSHELSNLRSGSCLELFLI